MNDVELIFKPRSDPIGDPMRIAALLSGGGSAIPFMKNVVGAISSDKNASGIEKNKKRGVPTRVNDVHDFYNEYKKPIGDMEVRELYYNQDLAIIEEEGWNPDIIACSGHMYYITKNFLDSYTNRILNVHPADLSILDENGKRKYVGDNAVKDAMEAGEIYTRSTIHIMNEVTDGGPILYMSTALPVGDRSPEEQQDKMKIECDGPAYEKTTNKLSTGSFGIDSKQNIYVEKEDEFLIIYRDLDGKYFGDILRI